MENTVIKLSEGVNFLRLLRNEFTREMNGILFCMNSCPFGDIWNDFNKQHKNIKTILTEIEMKINTYDDAYIELEKFNIQAKQISPDIILSNEDTYKKKLCKTKINNIEFYNLTLYTISICGLCIETIIKKDV